MIDKLIYSFCGLLDKFCNLFDKIFFKKKKKK
jgi:hypothetical protein